MNPPLVAPNAPSVQASWPNVSPQTMTVGATAGAELAGPTLKDIAPSTWPTWVKLLAASAVIALLAVIAASFTRRR